MKNGFTFPELLIVLACIGLIALIAVPVLASMKLSANEALATENMRTYYKAQHTYRFIHLSSSEANYGTAYQLLDEGLIEPEFADAINDNGSSVYYGYLYSELITTDPPYPYSTCFQLESGPCVYNVDGKKQFYMTSDGVIFYRDIECDGLAGILEWPPVSFATLQGCGYQMLPFPRFP